MKRARVQVTMHMNILDPTIIDHIGILPSFATCADLSGPYVLKEPGKNKIDE